VDAVGNRQEDRADRSCATDAEAPRGGGAPAAGRGRGQKN
jgi:hypothetical protein